MSQQSLSAALRYEMILIDSIIPEEETVSESVKVSPSDGEIMRDLD